MKSMNKQRASLTALALSLALLPASGALAQGAYFGVSGGLASIDLSKSTLDAEYFGDPDDYPAGTTARSSLDDSDEAWGVQVGYRWGSYVAAEVGYVNFGEALYDLDVQVTGGGVTVPFEVTSRLRSSGPTLAVLGLLPLSERFELHGRAGIYFSDTRIQERLIVEDTGEVLESVETDGSDKDVFLGIGAAWNINDSFSLRVEYQRFLDVGDEDHGGERDVDLITLGVLFR